MPDVILNTDASEEGQSKGIVGEIIDGLHKVEAAVENLIHPSEQEGGAATAGEIGSAAPVEADASSSPSQSIENGAADGFQAAVAIDSAPAVAALGELQSSSGSFSMNAASVAVGAATDSTATSAGNATSVFTSDLGPLSSALGSEGLGEPNNASGDLKPDASGDALTGTDDPNAVASPAVSVSASDTASSASPASSDVDTAVDQKADAFALLESLPAEALHAVHTIISEIESDLTEVSIGLGLYKLAGLKEAIAAKL